MKRYDEHLVANMGDPWQEVTEDPDGRYVLFTDAQADKHAALKELAKEVLPRLGMHRLGCTINHTAMSMTVFIDGYEPGKCNCGLRELMEKLKSLTERPV